VWFGRDGAALLSAAADLFGRLRRAVAARYPAALPTCCELAPAC
jgi:hypothetical protein